MKLTCPGCGVMLRVGDEQRGKRFRCPKCRQPVKVAEPVRNDEPEQPADEFRFPDFEEAAADDEVGADGEFLSDRVLPAGAGRRRAAAIDRRGGGSSGLLWLILAGTVATAIWIVGIPDVAVQPFDQAVQQQMDDIHSQVAEDAVRQYEIAARNGSEIDKHVAAGFAAAAYLQAQDEANYQKWVAVRDRHARAAGLPVP